MKIVIDSHTLKRARERGTNETEVGEVIAKGFPITVKKNRLCRALVFPYGRIWNGRYYQEKRVEVVYRMEGEQVITVTVYVFYGRWEVESEDRIPG